ncbi:MAG TPA: ECF transporter S component [Anaerolineales bacterium]|nr:ECF transporter S component [Anaerolineales bacterium]
MTRRLTPANLIFGLLSLAGLVAFAYPFWAPAGLDPSQMRPALFLFSGSLAMILVAMLAEAQEGLTAHTIAMLGALVGLNTALRMMDNLVPLPGGFSPVFLLIALVGYVFGARLGFLMGALTLLISDPLSPGGLGPWTPYQMLAAGWVGMGAAFLPKRAGALGLAVYAGLWGWLFGVLTNLYYWPYALGAPDISWQPGLGWGEILARYGRYYLVTSLAWDTMRAIGNVVLLGALGPSLIKVLERFRRRAYVAWEPA